MNKPIFSYRESEDLFLIYRQKIQIGSLFAPDVSEQFVKWMVDLLNEHYEKFSVERSEKILREMGF